MIAPDGNISKPIEKISIVSITRKTPAKLEKLPNRRAGEEDLFLVRANISKVADDHSSLFVDAPRNEDKLKKITATVNDQTQIELADFFDYSVAHTGDQLQVWGNYKTRDFMVRGLAFREIGSTLYRCVETQDRCGQSNRQT